MRIVVDAPKRLANLDRHGLDLAEFETAFGFDRFLSRPTRPSRTGRPRFVLVGLWKQEDVVVALVSPLGTEALSVVSVRPANAKERAAYANA